MSTDLDLVLHLLEVRFPLDERERIDPTAAPRTPLFVLVRTRLGCIWRFRADVPVEAVRGLAKLAGREPALASPVVDSPPPERLTPMMRVLEEQGVVSEVKRELVLFNRLGSKVNDTFDEAHPSSDEARARIVHTTTESELDAILNRPSSLEFVTLDWKLRSALCLAEDATPAFEPIAELIVLTEVQASDAGPGS